MSETLRYSGQLAVSFCWCGMRHAIPAELHDYQQRSFDNEGREISVYCPLGHSYVLSGKSKAAKLQERLEAEQARAAAIQDQLTAEQRSHAATKGQLTKTRKRVGKGVCPCCNRHFVNVERHMATKHPDYSSREPETP